MVFAAAQQEQSVSRWQLRTRRKPVLAAAELCVRTMRWVRLMVCGTDSLCGSCRFSFLQIKLLCHSLPQVKAAMADLCDTNPATAPPCTPPCTPPCCTRALLVYVWVPAAAADGLYVYGCCRYPEIDAPIRVARNAVVAAERCESSICTAGVCDHQMNEAGACTACMYCVPC